MFDRLFDRLEFIIGLVIYDLGRGDSEDGWGPIGRFAWRAQQGDGVYDDLEAELEGPARSRLLRGGLFRGDTERLAARGDHAARCRLQRRC